MAQINLLPWREIQRADRQREFLTVLGACVMGAVLLLIPVYLIINGMVDYQKSRNKYLSDQIVILDNKIREIKGLKSLKLQLLARMKVIQELQLDRAIAVRLFDEMIKILPSTVYLTSLDKTGSKFLVSGVAQSNEGISLLMRNIEQSHLVTQPLLREINTSEKEGLRRNDFSLSMSQIGAGEAPVTQGPIKIKPSKR